MTIVKICTHNIKILIFIKITHCGVHRMIRIHFTNLCFSHMFHNFIYDRLILSETRTEIFEKVFGYLNGRLWMPAQVHFEYLKNKEKVSEKPISSYQRLISKQNKDGGYVSAIVDKTRTLQSQGLGEIKNQLKTLKEQTLGTEKHPYLSPEIYAEFDSALSTLESTSI